MTTTICHECPICYDEIPVKNCVTMEPCDHVFCEPCATEWLTNSTTCALCRTPVTCIHRANRGEVEAMKKKSMENFKTWLATAGLSEKNHQSEGLKWCLNREIGDSVIYRGKRGGLIADEMGLGKTILSLGLIISNFVPRTLIVLPPALISQWTSEISRLLGHTPLVFWGPKKSKITDETLSSAPIVVTTYSHISCDFTAAAGESILRTLHKYEWDRVIFDESHHMRNRKRNYNGAMRLKSKITWLLTGTPIHNRVTDLKAYFALLGIAMPHDKEDCATVLKSVTLRRTIDDAGLILPETREHHIDVPWETPQERDAAEQVHSMANLFRVTRENVHEAFRMLGQHILTTLIRSRQMCVLPSMILGSMSEDPGNDVPRRTLGSNASKMNAVVSKLLERKDNGRKKLVFCHFRQEIDYITRHMRDNDISCDFFDGRVSSAERRSILMTSPDVLVLQMKTACEGLNLQQYQEVYFVSPHWNPSVEDQAIGRCRRIGQTSEIDVFRFTMENFSNHAVTLDNFCLSVQEIKRELRDIIQSTPVSAQQPTHERDAMSLREGVVA